MLDYNDILRALDAYGTGNDPDDPKTRTRGRILRAATELFRKHGYRRTSIDEVAQAAGVAKGTVYVHFKNKNELLVHAIGDEKKHFIGRIRPVLTAKTSPLERIEAYIAMAFELADEMPLVSSLMGGDREMLLALEEMAPEMRAEIAERQVQMIGAMLEGVGHFSELSPEEKVGRTRALLAILHAARQLVDPRLRAGMSVAEFSKYLARTIVRGLAAP